MSEMLYLVCFDMQKKAIKEFCFGECKKIIVGVVEYGRLFWFPCRQANCDYCEKEKDIGHNEVGDQEENVVLRKLKES